MYTHYTMCYNIVRFALVHIESAVIHTVTCVHLYMLLAGLPRSALYHYHYHCYYHCYYYHFRYYNYYHYDDYY